MKSWLILPVILFFLSSLEAEEISAIRTRLESSTEGNSHIIKETIGVGSVIDQWSEIFRLYHYNIIDTNKDIDYFAGGFKLPVFKISNDVKNETTIFGQTGDIRGGGLQSISSINNFLLILNGEGRDLDDDIGIRTGVGLEYRFTQFTFGLAYDYTKKLDENHYTTIKAIYDQSKTDSLGIGLQKAINDDIGTSFFYTHWGPKEDWGTRLFLTYGQTSKIDNYFGYVIISEHPTYIREDAMWWVGRNVNDRFDMGFNDSAILQEEPPSISERAEHGFSFMSKSGYNHYYSFLNNSISYTWAIGSYKPSIIGIYNTNFKKNWIGGGIELRVSNIFKIEANSTFTNGKPQIYAGIQIGIKF